MSNKQKISIDFSHSKIDQYFNFTVRKLALNNKNLIRRYAFLLKLALISLTLFLQACVPIQLRAYDGDFDAVQSYIEEGGDVNLEELYPGLCVFLVNCAIAGGQDKVVRYLLDQGADVNKYAADDTPLNRAILAGNLSMVRLLIERHADVNQVNPSTGFTPLVFLVLQHTKLGWARSKPIAEELIKAGANINHQDYYGLYALHHAAAIPENIDGVTWLVSQGADTTLQAGEKRMRAIDIAREIGNEKIVMLLAEYEVDHLDWENASDTKTLAMYQLYLERYPKGLYVEEAATKVKALEAELELAEKARQQEFLAFQRKQPCSLNDENWVYLKGACRANKANGQGEAMTMDGLKFIGHFENGYRVKGEIFHNNTLMFDGSIKQGKPHGNAVCIHEGRPESCEFYKGKRIDGVFIQRLDFAHQQKLLTEQQRKIEERLAQNEEKMNQMANNLNSARGNQARATQGSSNGVGDMLLDKASDQAVQAIFNHLF